MAGAGYGGQAVVEGVMVRGPHSMGIACRRLDGAIVCHAEQLGSVHSGRAARVPLVRGVLALGETLVLGMRALKFSSAVAMARGDEQPRFPEGVFWGSLAIALGFVAAFFFATPSLIASLLGRLGAGHGLIAVAEGVVRLGLFTGYIAAVGLLPGIRRVFQYHGAEHMTIHASEAGAPLDVAGVRPFSTAHRRCGTSFLFVVVMTAFVSFLAFDVLAAPTLVERLLSRVVLIPAVAAVAYELLRLGARCGERSPLSLLFLPNLALQRLTTRVPDDSQIEVALAAYTAAVAAAEPAPEPAAALVSAAV